MNLKDTNQLHRVALIGVAHSTLLFGRALALAEIPLVGIYDPDPSNALRGALFLGISGQTETDTFEQSKPTVLLCAQPYPGPVPDSVGLCLDLGHNLGGLGPRDCRVEFAEALPERLPTEITSALPHLVLTLTGTPEARQSAQEFFNLLAPEVQTVVET